MSRGVQKGTKRGPYKKVEGVKKQGSERELLAYYKRQIKNKLIKEQAGKEAQGGLPTTKEIKTFFDLPNLNYAKLMTEGITRKEGNKTKRYYGSEAVLIQIQSLKNRTSPSKQKDLFIENYSKAMANAGYSATTIQYVSNQLSKLSNIKLTYLIDKGALPQISFIYAEVEENGILLQEIKDSIRLSSGESYKEYKSKRKALFSNVKERLSII